MPYRLLEEAREDLRGAVRYYEEQRTGLGREFVVEVRRAVDRILHDPTSYARITNRIRRCSVHRFPYDVLYAIRDETVLVVTIMHHRRRPGFWKSRIKDLD